MAFIIAFAGFCVVGGWLGMAKKRQDREEWRSREEERRSYQA